MTPERKSSIVLLVLLSLLVFVYNLGAGIQLINGVEPSATSEFLYQAAFLCGVVWWLRSVGRSPALPVYCPGLLVGAGWLIIIPYHLLKTRGVKGLLPLLALVGSFVVAYILAVIAYMLLASNPP